MTVAWPPLSMGFSRQEYWSGLPCPPAEYLPDPGIKPMSLKSPVLAGGFFTTRATWESPHNKRPASYFNLDLPQKVAVLRHFAPLLQIAF